MLSGGTLRQYDLKPLDASAPAKKEWSLSDLVGIQPAAKGDRPFRFRLTFATRKKYLMVCHCEPLRPSRVALSRHLGAACCRDGRPWI